MPKSAVSARRKPRLATGSSAPPCARRSTASYNGFIPTPSAASSARAYVHVGQFARLKFSAYDFAIHGSLQGIVTFVSADTITNEEGESFFLVRVKPSKSFLGVKSGELPIKIGMTAEADIITDKKTILSYLTEPVHRGIDKALRER